MIYAAFLRFGRDKGSWGVPSVPRAGCFAGATHELPLRRAILPHALDAPMRGAATADAKTCNLNKKYYKSLLLFIILTKTKRKVYDNDVI